jgi:hypothetical protein
VGDETTTTTEPPADATATTTTTTAGSDPEPHCAQGVVKVRTTGPTGVLGATAGSGGTATQGSAAPITFTG